MKKMPRCVNKIHVLQWNCVKLGMAHCLATNIMNVYLKKVSNTYYSQRRTLYISSEQYFLVGAVIRFRLHWLCILCMCMCMYLWHNSLTFFPFAFICKDCRLRFYPFLSKPHSFRSEQFFFYSSLCMLSV